MTIFATPNKAQLNPEEVAILAKQMPREESVHPIASAIADSQAKNPAPIKIDPKKVRWSEWGNRLQERFDGPAFEAFVEDIRSTKGNKTPGVVRRLEKPDEKGHEFELASGHRRHSACLAAAQPFYAFVRELTDLELQDELETENRNREDTAPMERAIQYKKQLPSYRSQEHMSSAMKIGSSTMSRYLMLADLPKEVLELIQNRLEISLEAGCTLMQFILDPANDEVFQKNLTRLQALKIKLPAKDVLKLLRERPDAGVQKQKLTELTSELLTNSGAQFGSMSVNRKKELKISIDGITSEEFEKVKEALLKTLKRK